LFSFTLFDVVLVFISIFFGTRLSALHHFVFIALRPKTFETLT